MASPEDRGAYKAAFDEICRIEQIREQLVAPTNDIFDAAKRRLEDVVERTGEPVCTCEACGMPVFEGELGFPGPETDLCGACAPTYEELLSTPDSFVDADGDPLGAERSIAWFEEHIAGGGKPTDSMARVL
jgi:hypothetical protein